ncbi:carbohydrate ABC transporter permease [Bosea caraganae]|uniref:Carbohydrate ABC transporter permease n=1 Tax=Bosea caraganae TaxID=2763117 RepID=A0A370LAF4_9HYPH|nr:carbohydrate ABC transporter permease [Bosea caraganae]RDJ21687.1 carbohydrate ABC transporter permease [Bosea caraganae]RDJ28282.1 carbohydrate ABC transporter permease [Bosea caraganae]
MNTAKRRARRIRAIWVAVGSAAVLLYSLGPLLWIFIASITPELKADFNQAWLSNRQVTYFPSEPTLANYGALFETVPFATYFRNSSIIATGNMVLTLVVASLGAYGFVRFRFFGRSSFLVAMLVAYTIPSVVLLVPLLVIFRTYGLNNTHLGMILAEATHSAPFVLLLMINYFSTLPRDLDEAAQVDGCSRLKVLWRIILPLSLPGLVAGGLLAFIMTWNNFLFAFLLTSTAEVKTLPVIMRQFALGEPAVWGISAAGALVSTLPVALIFLLFQRMLMSGLAAGAVKG